MAEQELKKCPLNSFSKCFENTCALYREAKDSKDIIFNSRSGCSILLLARFTDPQGSSWNEEQNNEWMTVKINK
jgi:hypothetical protein